MLNEKHLSYTTRTTRLSVVQATRRNTQGQVQSLISMLWVQHDVLCEVKWRRFVKLFS